MNIALTPRNDIPRVNGHREVETDNVREPEHGEVVVGVPQLDGHFVGHEAGVSPHVTRFSGATGSEVPLTHICVLYE